MARRVTPATVWHLDAAGNVVVTGYFSGTVDFDPGLGVSNLASAGDNDIFVVRLSGAGDLCGPSVTEIREPIRVRL